MVIADRKAMVIAPESLAESSDSQESNISKLDSFGDILFFCYFLGLQSLNLSWRYDGPALANMKIVAIALCHHLREAFILMKKKKSLNMGIA